MADTHANEFWFRRWFRFSYVPVCRQGRAAIWAFLAVELCVGAMSFRVEAESQAWWLFAVMGFAIFLGFWAFVESKTEPR